MASHEISLTDPRSDDVLRLLHRHVAFAHSHVPPPDRHALDAEGLVDPDIAFYALRVDGELMAVGAIKQLDARHAELKSMHTVEGARRRGLGRLMLEHLLTVARERGVRRVSLETGSAPAFAPARALYTSAGFTACGPFGEYAPSQNKTFMTLEITPTRAATAARSSSNPD